MKIMEKPAQLVFSSGETTGQLNLSIENNSNREHRL